MKISKYCIIGFLLITNNYAQSPLVEWTKTIGGVNPDRGYCIKNTNDGGFIIVGNTFDYNAGRNNIYLVKINNTGDTVWTKTYGGESEDYGRSVQQTSDGGFIVLGWSFSFSQNYSFSDMYLIKTNENGDSLWTKLYGGWTYDYGYSVQQLADEGYILSGETQSFGNPDGNAYLVRTDNLGDTLWTKVLPGSIRYDHSVQQTSDGGFIISSHTGNILLTKTDDSGNIIWTKPYGGNNSEYGGCVQQTYDNGYVILGETNSFGAGGYDLYIIKTNEFGDTSWTKTYGAIYNDYAHYIIQSRDSGFVAIGELSNFGIGPTSFFLVGLDKDGQTLFTESYGGQSIDISQCVQQTPDNGFILCGYSSSFGSGDDDIYLIKTGEIIVNSQSTVHFPTNFILEQNYPNPFNPNTTIKFKISELRFTTLKVYDILGNEIATLVNEEKPAGEYEIDFNGTELPSGIYFYQLREGKYVETKKMVYLK